MLLITIKNAIGMGLHGVVAKMLDFNILVSEFELLSCYYVHFRTNTIGNGMNFLKLYYSYSSARMALELNYPCRLICP